jgi:LCP family protein required for cell wall assembly
MTVTAPPRPAPSVPPRPSPSSAPSGSALRRAILLVLATLVLPGSAQYWWGNRRIGRLAFRVLGVLLVLALLLAGLGMVRSEAAVALLTNGVVLTVVRFGVLVLGVGWLYLVLDAWRLGRPMSLARQGRLVLTAVTAAVFLLASSVIAATANVVAVVHQSVGAIFSSGAAIGTVDGRYNVLLVGGDRGKGRVGMRPDSLTVASVDAETGRAALVGIPRNLQDVPFPEGSSLAEEFPNGYDCGDACLVNALYTWGAENADVLGPDVADPGLEATRLAAEGITGLQIPFTVVVDMRGFTELVDALGGVVVDVGRPVPIGGGTGPVIGTIEAGVQRLDGFEALWFARSREGSSDYERMARQKCLTASLARQLSPMAVLANVEALAEASQVLVRTDIPTSDVPGLLQVAQRARGQAIDAVSLVPPLVDPARPDYDEVHAIVERVLAGEPAAGDAATDGPGDGGIGNAGSSASATQTGSVPGASADAEDGQEATGTAGPRRARDRDATAEDLGLVCQAV